MKRRIMYVQYTSPAAYPPLEHSAGLLSDRGWEVLFLGIRKHGDPSLHWPLRRGITVRELAPSGPGWSRRLHYARFAIWVFAWIVRWRPACVYASDALSCPVVLPLSYLPGLKIVYHEHDAPPDGRAGLVPWMRRKLAARAQVRVLPNERRARHFNRYVANHRPTFNVWNCPSRMEVSPPRASHLGRRLQLLYVGSIVPARLPPSVIEALVTLPDEVHLRVIGYVTAGHRDYATELATLARKLDVGHRTEFVAAMPHPDLLVASRAADVGLVLMPDTDDANQQWMPGASNKPFDYLAGGLALLVSNLTGWRDLYVEPGYGLACEARDPRSIASALRWFIDHPTEMRAMGERGRQRVVAEWNYEAQFAPVQDWLDADRDRRPRSI